MQTTKITEAMKVTKAAITFAGRCFISAVIFFMVVLMVRSLTAEQLHDEALLYLGLAGVFGFAGFLCKLAQLLGLPTYRY